MKQRNRILVCPLDWGLGHATRCVPVIRTLLELNQNVVIGADGRPLALLKDEFPELEFIRMPGYDITYPATGNLAVSMLLQGPKIAARIKQEHKLLEQVVASYAIDAVISDNRFGLWHSRIPSAFITHQVFIQAPVGAKALNVLNHRFISRFSQCWIPDVEEAFSLGGILSHGSHLPNDCQYIGPLSRFEDKQGARSKKWDLLGMVSGPEPQRTVFQKLLIDTFAHSGKRCLVVCGKPEEEAEGTEVGKVRIVSHLNATQLKETMLESELVVARPGYSTIMDLVALQKEAVLIPTPGQTEQEYLGKHHMEKGHFFVLDQKAVSNIKTFEKSSDFKCPRITDGWERRFSVVQQFLHMI